MRLMVGALVALAMVPASGQAPATRENLLRIRVIAGEDAVNIIQQKTAVAPIVEVRDRNNLPVPGAVVTFAVEGGKAASFAGGASTLTVTTMPPGRQPRRASALWPVAPCKSTCRPPFRAR